MVVALAQARIKVDQDFGDFSIGEALAAANQRATKSFLAEAAGAVEIEDGRDGWTIFVLHQTAQVIGEALREHGNDPAGKVYRCSPGVGFPVDRRTWADVMGDVGN